MPGKDKSPGLPEGLMAGVKEDADQLLVGGWVRRRQSPIAAARKAAEQAEQDGDPRFDFMVSAETLAKFPDKFFLWVPEDDVRRQKGKMRGFEECRGGDGIELASGVKFIKDELIIGDGQQLMMCDRGRKNDRDERERRMNDEARKKMIKKAHQPHITYEIDGTGRTLEQMQAGME